MPAHILKMTRRQLRRVESPLRSFDRVTAWWGKRLFCALAWLAAAILVATGCMAPAWGDQAGPGLQPGNQPPDRYPLPSRSGREAGVMRVIVSLEGIPLGEQAGPAVRAYVQRYVAPLAPDVQVMDMFRFQPSFSAVVTPKGRRELSRLPRVRRVTEDSISRAQPFSTAQ